MRFKSENHMRGKSGIMLCVFAAPFLGGGILFGSFIPEESRYQWPAVFHLAFVLLGIGLVCSAAYAATRGISFYTLVDGEFIEWGRHNSPDQVQRLRIDDLRKIVYTSDMDAGFDVILVDKAGSGHKISGEFLYSGSEAKRLLSFFRENYSSIEIISEK